MRTNMTRGGLVAAIGILISITSVHSTRTPAQEAAPTEALAAKGAWKPNVIYRRDDGVTARGST